MQPIRIFPQYALIFKYDIRPGAQERYYRFVTSVFLPALQERKLYMQNAWQIVYGDEPERHIEFITETLSIIRELFDDPEWESLETRLREFTENYTLRVIRYRGPFKL